MNWHPLPSLSLSLSEPRRPGLLTLPSVPSTLSPLSPTPLTSPPRAEFPPQMSPGHPPIIVRPPEVLSSLALQHLTLSKSALLATGASAFLFVRRPVWRPLPHWTGSPAKAAAASDSSWWMCIAQHRACHIEGAQRGVLDV